MALFNSTGRKPKPMEDEAKNDPRLGLAKDHYMAGRFKIVTLDSVPTREVLGTFGLIVCRSYNFDNAFYGLIAQALKLEPLLEPIAHKLARARDVLYLAREGAAG